MKSSVAPSAGVDLTAGDSVSKIASEFCKRTYQNGKPYVSVDASPNRHFRGPLSYRVEVPKGAAFTLAPDGIGTKVGLIASGGTFTTAGHDLVAMTADDVSRWGGLPLVMTNVLDIRHPGAYGSKTRQAILELYQGLHDAAMHADLVLLNGETAQLGTYVGSEETEPLLAFNWSGMVQGLMPKRIIDGSRVGHGQPVVALRERGFRSNGMTDVRAALRQHLGDGWASEEEGRSLAREAAWPSTIYSPLLARANGWRNLEDVVDITYIAHITGGGIRDKFGRDAIMRFGFSAWLYNLFDPPDMMRWCAQMLGKTNEEAHATWNCGNGMLVVLADDEEAIRFISLAKREGYEARMCGVVTKPDGEPTLKMTSRFDYRNFDYCGAG